MATLEIADPMDGIEIICVRPEEESPNDVLYPGMPLYDLFWFFFVKQIKSQLKKN
jgi:hypothetical protein